MQREAGTHRVQRIPPTEKRGRVHSSSVTVAIITHKQSDSPEIRHKDLAFRWHAGTGPGGQNRNKVKCCLELTHIPSGIKINANGRSRKDNEREAMQAITRALHKSDQQEQADAVQCDRKAQIGLGGRSDERIRTWRLQDGKVMDHRTGAKVSYAKIAKGQLELLG